MNNNMILNLKVKIITGIYILIKNLLQDTVSIYLNITSSVQKLLFCSYKKCQEVEELISTL